MAATVHQLHRARPISAILRVGHRDHRWLEDRLAAGKLFFRRFVFDAAHLTEQMSLVAALRKAGCEIVLDTNFAELRSVGKFQSAASKLPWARDDRPWRSDDLGGNRLAYVTSQIAEFALAHQVDAVVSPGHLIDADNDDLEVDVSFSSSLRNALNRLGGPDIALDHQVILTAATLRDSDFRKSLKASLSNVQADNVWLRTSGFDANSTGTGTRRYIESLQDLHEAGFPIIGDMTGGLPGLAAAAAGAIGGISHGVGIKESFRASDYRRIPVGSGGGGVRRIYVADLGRWISEEQFDQITRAKGAKSKLYCRDTNCCPQGNDDMRENPKAHFLFQRSKQIKELSKAPESRREEHFLIHQVGPALRLARTLSRLQYEDPKVGDVIFSEKKRLTLMNDVLSDLLVDAPKSSRSNSPLFRGGGSNIAVLGGTG